MQFGSTADALITVFADGMLVGTNANNVQALEILHDTSVGAKQNRESILKGEISLLRWNWSWAEYVIAL